MKYLIIILIICFSLIRIQEVKALDMTSLAMGMAIGGSKDEKILNINSKSVVRVLQETLNNAGYKVNVDGMYGDKTFEAVKKFQKNNNLISDGLIGKETLLILIKYIK